MDPVLLRLDDLERRLALLEATHPMHRELPRLHPEPVEEAPHVAARRDAETHRAPRPIVPPPRVARLPATPPTSDAEPLAPGALERWLGGVLLARVGIAAVVLAAAWFAQLAYRYVSAEVKVLSLYALAASLLGAAWVLRRRAAARYLALLEGGAVAVAYVAGLAAALKYHLVGPEVGLALMAGAAALGAWLGCRRGAEPLAGVSVLGALAAPHMLGLVAGQHVLVLVLAVGVNAWSAWGARRFGWTATRAAAFVGAFALITAWYAGAREWTAHGRSVGLHLMLGLLLLPELVDLARRRALATWMAILGVVAVGLTIGNHVLLDVLADMIDSNHAPWAWLTSLAWFTLALVLGSPGRGRVDGAFVRWLARLGGTGLALGFVAWAHADGAPYGVRLAGVALLAATFVGVRARTGAGHFAAFVAGLLAWGLVEDQASAFARAVERAPTLHALIALFVLALVPAAALVLGDPTRPGPRPAPATWSGAVLGGVTLLASLTDLADRRPDLWLVALTAAALWYVGVAWAARRQAGHAAVGATVLGVVGTALTWVGVGLVMPRLPGWMPGLDPITLAAFGVALAAIGARRLLLHPSMDTLRERTVLGAVALALPVLAGGREVFLLTRHLPGMWSPILMSVYLTLVAAGLLGLGFRLQSRSIRIAALALFLGVILKVGLSDLAKAPLELRVLVTLVLGLALLASAYAYARRGTAIDRAPRPPAPPSPGAPPTPRRPLPGGA